MAIRIDKLPCRGAPHNPTRLIPFGRTHFPGSCPASEDQHVAAPPRHNREVSTLVYILWRRGLGPSPIAHLHVARAAESRPSNLQYNGSHVTRSNLVRAAQSLTSRRLRLIPRRRVPISFPRS